MYYKKIKGERIYLSPIDINDCQKATEWLNDIDVTIGTTLSNKVINEFSEKNILETLSKGYKFAIVDDETDNAMGFIGFVDLDHINQVGEIGILIGDKSYWHGGYGKEAMELLMDFGFNLLNLNNIFLKVYSFNTIAINCYKKIGFKEVGRVRESKIIVNKKYDVIIMDMLASEFKVSSIIGSIEHKYFD